MCKIMDSMHKYIPSITVQKIATLPHGEQFQYDDYDLWETLFGGDQLTVTRARGATDIRVDHDPADEKLRGLIPVIEDWHSRMTFLKVSLYQ